MTSIAILETLKNRPCQADRSEVGKRPSPTEKTPHKPNAAAERARLFFGNDSNVESRVKAGKTRRRQTRHLSIFRASENMLLGCHKSFYIKDLKVHPTGFEPVTTGSVDGSKILFSLSLSFYPIRLYGKYASIFSEF